MKHGAAVYALVTGGGTGGHVYPALAVAEELVRRGHERSAIRFVGSRRGLEASVVPSAGFPIDLLSGRGIQRSFRPRAVVANLGAVAGIVRAFFSANRIIKKYRPRVVLGVGGYASLPCLVAARLRRLPAVVHEQNAAPGLANRVAVRLGAQPAISMAGTPLRGAVLTGNPVRSAITEVRRSPQVAPALVAIVGGSLGARRINDAALALFDVWRDRGDVAVRHVAGARDLQRCREHLEHERRSSDLLGYELIGYEDDMVGLYERCAVLVGRAGAVTCAELAVTGTPSVLIPLSNAPADHQTRNAESLERSGAAVIVPDGDIDGRRLASELDALLEGTPNPKALQRMGDAAKTLGRPRAAAAVADLVVETAEAGSTRVG